MHSIFRADNKTPLYEGFQVAYCFSSSYISITVSIKLEPLNLDWPIKIRALGQNQSEEFILENGNKSDHKSHVDKLKPWIEDTATFDLWFNEAWIPIWDTPKEKEVLKTVLNDYFRLLNQTNE